MASFNGVQYTAAFITDPPQRVRAGYAGGNIVSVVDTHEAVSVTGSGTDDINMGGANIPAAALITNCTVYFDALGASSSINVVLDGTTLIGTTTTTSAGSGSATITTIGTVTTNAATPVINTVGSGALTGTITLIIEYVA